MGLTDDAPLVSVVLLNYNGRAWMERCLESLAAQTIFARTEVIVADNASPDGSDRQAAELMAGWANGQVIQNGGNFGFGKGCNLVVGRTRGKYLLFLNPDVWLERDCLEQLVRAADAARAGIAGVLVLDYEDDRFQNNGADAFDLCGHLVMPRPGATPEVLWSANGFIFIRRDLFLKVGGYDDTFFLYGEEGDLSWRVWLAGERVTYAPAGRIHHRGAAAVNPKGGTKVVELRTSESKRFYSNRNHLLTLLKNAQHLLLLLVLTATMLMALEGLAGLVFLRRWSFFKRTCLDALADCWRLRGHICAERRRIKIFRRRGDFWMLRFLTWRFNRLQELGRMRQLGKPIVDKR